MIRTIDINSSEVVYKKNIGMVFVSLFLFSGCGSLQESEDLLSSAETQETAAPESEYYEMSVAEETTESKFTERGMFL